jgi:hypothetical protein
MGITISINDQAAFNVVIGVPGPTGPAGPAGPAGPTFTGGAITSPITFDAGTNSTAFENGDVYAQDNTSGSYGAIYTGGLQASNGTLTLDITGAGITFGDSSVQSTAFPGSSAFYPSTGNPSGFLTAASLSGYATQSWVTSQGYATQSYVNGQGFITASALSPYLLSSTAASTYQTLAGMSGYLSKAGNLSGLSNTATARTNLGLGTMATQTASNYLTVSAAASGYYPLSGNPSGFLTDAPSDGSQYARQDGAWSVVTGGGGGSYLPLAGGTMTGPIVFDGTSGQYISKGNFDTSRGGNYGISLVCSIGYEFNWQAGWLTTTEQSSVTPRPLYLDSLAGTTLRVWDSSTSLGTEVSHTGITFPDSTVQTTAAAGFVPGSGDLDLDGYAITDGNFDSPAGQVSAQNVTLSSGGVLTFGDSTVQTTAYTGGGGATNNNQLTTNVNNYTTAATLIAPVDGNAIAVCQGGCYAIYLGDSSAGWQVGQQVLIVNRSGSTIFIQNYGASSNISYNGGYILGINGVCAAVYVDTNFWVISGNLTT